MISAARRRVNRLGRRGENIACELLKNCGMDILARNWRCRAGELDIVALDGAEMVFVEVKTLRFRKNFTPAANLSPRQRRRNFHAANVYLRALRIVGRPARFDLVEAVFFGPLLLSLRRIPDYLPPLPPVSPREEAPL